MQPSQRCAPGVKGIFKRNSKKLVRAFGPGKIPEKIPGRSPEDPPGKLPGPSAIHRVLSEPWRQYWAMLGSTVFAYATMPPPRCLAVEKPDCFNRASASAERAPVLQ